MAIIPAGTTNDYARALKIPRDNIVKAAEVIKNQTVKWILAKPAKLLYQYCGGWSFNGTDL